MVFRPGTTIRSDFCRLRAAGESARKVSTRKDSTGRGRAAGVASEGETLFPTSARFVARAGGAAGLAGRRICSAVPRGGERAGSVCRRPPGRGGASARALRCPLSPLRASGGLPGALGTPQPSRRSELAAAAGDGGGGSCPALPAAARTRRKPRRRRRGQRRQRAHLPPAPTSRGLCNSPACTRPRPRPGSPSHRGHRGRSPSRPARARPGSAPPPGAAGEFAASAQARRRLDAPGAPSAPCAQLNSPRMPRPAGEGERGGAGHWPPWETESERARRSEPKSKRRSRHHAGWKKNIQVLPTHHVRRACNLSNM